MKQHPTLGIRRFSRGRFDALYSGGQSVTILPHLNLDCIAPQSADNRWFSAVGSDNATPVSQNFETSESSVVMADGEHQRAVRKLTFDNAASAEIGHPRNGTINQAIVCGV